MKSIGISVVMMGIILIVIGVVFMFHDKIPIIGKLPGDIKIIGKNSSFNFRITTCIIISIILSIILGFFSKFFKG